MRVLEGQSLLDICIKLYGTLEALFVLAEANGISLDSLLYSGDSLSSPSFTPNIAAVDTDTIPAPENSKTIIGEGQTILDLVIQVTGGLEGLFDISAKNGLALSQDLSIGQAIQFNSGMARNQDLVNYFSAKNYRVNTRTLLPTSENPEGVLWVDGDGAFIVDGDGSYILVES